MDVVLVGKQEELVAECAHTQCYWEPWLEYAAQKGKCRAQYPPPPPVSPFVGGSSF